MQSADLPGQLLDQSLFDRALLVPQDEAVFPRLLNRRVNLSLEPAEGTLDDLQRLQENSSHRPWIRTRWPSGWSIR